MKRLFALVQAFRELKTRQISVWIALVLSTNALGLAFSLFIPQYIGSFMSDSLASGSVVLSADLIWVAALLTGSCILLTTAGIAEGVTRALSEESFSTIIVSKFFSRDYAYQRNIQKGRLSTLIVEDVTNVVNAALHIWSRLFLHILFLIAVVVILIVTSWRLFFSLTIVLAIVIVTMAMLSARLSYLSNRVQDAIDALLAGLSAVSEYLLTVIAAKGQRDVIESLSGALQNLRERRAKYFIRANLLGPVGNYFVQVGLLSLLLIATTLKSAGMENAQTLTSFFTYLVFTIPSINAVTNSFETINGAYPSVQRIRVLTESVKTSHTDAFFSGLQAEDGVRLSPSSEKSMLLNDIKFRYCPDGDEISFPDCRLSIGKINLLIGGNGTGKSTLINILAGIEKPEVGTVKYCGFSGPPTISYAPQGAELVVPSVRSNLFLGLDSDSKRKDALRYMRELYGDERSLRLLKSRKSNGLSGGEKRRINLARTLANGGEILLLDEPTAGLDDGSVSVLVKRLVALVDDRLVVIVTHDQSLIEQLKQSVATQEIRL